MITYQAMFKFVEGGVHAEVLDFPGAISCGADLDAARANLASALTDLAELLLTEGKPLPLPDPGVTDEEADLVEPIHLLLEAASRVRIVPDRRAS